jgi:hypothetical protein
MKTKIFSLLLLVLSVFISSNSFAQSSNNEYTDWNTSLRNYAGIYQYWTENQMGSGNKIYFYVVFTYTNDSLKISMMDQQAGVIPNVTIQSISGNVVKTNLFTGKFITGISGDKGFYVTEGSYDDYFYDKTNSNGAKSRIKQIKAISKQ